MDGAYQPSETHARDNELHALEGFRRARPVIKQKQDSGANLHHKKEERNTAKVIPDRCRVRGHGLVRGKLADRLQSKTLVQPFRAKHPFSPPQARLAITTSSPRRRTVYSSSGAGGGPPTTLPFRS